MVTRTMFCRSLHWLWLMIALLHHNLAAQEFSLEDYQKFLDQQRGLDADGLRKLYPLSGFRTRAVSDLGNTLYADSIDRWYKLTSHERWLLREQSFMVTERITWPSFGHAYIDIYTRDLPVFITTDALLHPLHMSYDAILMELEQSALIPSLQAILTGLRAELPKMIDRYAAEPRMTSKLRDLDVYLTVPTRLLFESTQSIEPIFPENKERVEQLIELVRKELLAPTPLFTGIVRDIDFSQFTVRGHYTIDPQLGNYFKAMMWLGRTEIYLALPKGAGVTAEPEQLQQELIIATLLSEAMGQGELMQHYHRIDSTIQLMIGTSDNVTLPQLRATLAKVGITRADQLLDTVKVLQFQDTLLTNAWAYQRILSQVIAGDPSTPGGAKPASAFLLFGQRFIIDSYITANVVHDKVLGRMMPSSLDVLFALGNNGAAQFLGNCRQAPQLAALRYLIDSYDSTSWGSSFYNSWLNAIRSLNPPADRSGLPGFMQTAAWWQQKMNTQLASWAQLRHDNLLYAKQSYTAINGCSFPEALVEPIPEFYHRLATFAKQALAKVKHLPFSNQSSQKEVESYFRNLEQTAQQLAVIAQKELSHDTLSSTEKTFLTSMIQSYKGDAGCNPATREEDKVTIYYGWYADLFYKSKENWCKEDMVVADIHTDPNFKEVLHIGTGPLNMMVATCTLPDGRNVAYIGPVMSYYENITTNFKRLTDEEWKNEHARSARPAWTNLYLANKAGTTRGEAPSLVTGVNDRPPITQSNGNELQLSTNVPNPFTTSTNFGFTVPPLAAAAATTVTVRVFDMNGAVVRQLMQQQLPAGNYRVEWDGTHDNGIAAPAGNYLCEIRVGKYIGSIKMTRLAR